MLACSRRDTSRLRSYLHTLYLRYHEQVTLLRSNTILTTLPENGAEPSRPRAHRCFCERELEPVISRIGCILHAYVHVRVHVCPILTEEKTEKKRVEITKWMIAKEICLIAISKYVPREVELVRKSKYREKRLVTEARKPNEKTLTVRWSANCNPIFIEWFRVSIPGQHPASKVGAGLYRKRFSFPTSEEFTTRLISHDYTCLRVYEREYTRISFQTSPIRYNLLYFPLLHETLVR